VPPPEARRRAADGPANAPHEVLGEHVEASTPSTADATEKFANGLTRYAAAKRALAAAHRVDEVKDIRDKAAAMRVYAMQAKDRVLVDQATEIRLRAERRVGELLIEMQERGERETKGGDRKSKLQPGTLIPPKLSDLGVSNTQSSRWQKLAAIDDDAFEDVVDRARQGASAALDRAQQPRPKPKPKPKRRDATDVVATCVFYVEEYVRGAIAQLDPDERLGLFNQIETALRAIKAETDDPGTAAAERWSEA
jgi:hypothetical protein